MSKAKAFPQLPEKPDPVADREAGLAKNFEDPSLSEILPELSLVDSEGTPDIGTQSLLAETADAVKELVLEISPEESGSFAIEALDLVDTGGAPESVQLGALDLPDACPIEMPIQAGLDTSTEANKLHALADHSADRAVQATRDRMGDLFMDLVVFDRPFQELVESILGIMVQATSAEAGSILELDHEKREFFFRASRGGGDPEKLKAFRIPATKGIVGHVAETREALYLTELEKDQRQLLAISMSTGLETKSCLAAAIVVGGELYGVIELFNKMPENPFNEDDFAALQRGAKMAAKVLEVRFLMAELARRVA